METPLDYAARICYSSREVLQFSYDMSVKYKDSPGVYVECGVATGAQIIAFAYGAPHKTIYAFDSFEGIPLPSNKDDQMPGLRWLTEEEQKALPNPGEQVLESSGATVVSIQDFCNNIINSGVNGMNIVPIVGWFENTVPRLSETIEPIAILRLDGDLYNSTYVCLKCLYPKVIKGGVCVIDDWALPGCRQAVVDYFMDNGIVDFKYHWLKMAFIEDKNSTVAFWFK